MMEIDYKKILQADDVTFAIAQQRKLFIQDFLDQSKNESDFDSMKDLMDLYDAYWNSRMKILVKNGLSEQFAILNIVKRGVIEAAFNQHLDSVKKAES